MNQEELYRATEEAAQYLRERGIRAAADKGVLTCEYPDGGRVVLHNTLQHQPTFDEALLLRKIASAIVAAVAQLDHKPRPSKRSADRSKGRGVSADAVGQ